MINKINKKSQITLFILIGIVFLAVIALIFFAEFTKGDNGYKNNAVPSDVSAHINAVNKYVSECSLYTLGKNAGYNKFKPYLLAGLDESSQNINEFFEKVMPGLINLEALKGYESHYKKTSAEAEFGATDTLLKIKHDYILKKESKIFNGREFETKMNVRLKKLSDNAKIAQDEKDINLNEMNKLNFKKDIELMDKAEVFVFTDETSIINNMPYKFIFTKEK